MSYVATMPCQQSTGPVGIVTGQTPLSQIPGRLSGLGCTGCGGKCGCNQQLGLQGLTMDGSGFLGTGIFGTGVDIANFNTWGWPEYALAGLGILATFTLYSSVKRTGQRVGRGVRKVTGRVRKTRRKIGKAIGGGK